MNQPLTVERERELQHLLRMALDHKTCSSERPRVEGDELVIPFDVLERDRWTIKHERVRSRREFLEAFGY